LSTQALPAGPNDIHIGKLPAPIRAWNGLTGAGARGSGDYSPRNEAVTDEASEQILIALTNIGKLEALRRLAVILSRTLFALSFGE